MRRLSLSRQNGAVSRDRARLRQQSVALVAVVVLIMLVASLAGLLEGLELSAVDLAFRVRGPQPPASPVVIVAIDDNTLRNTSLQWPWPRTYFAQLLDRLAAEGARLIAFDVFFHEPESVSAPATYTVRGESVVQLAKQYGVGTDSILSANGLDNAGTICDRQELTIPTNPAVTHVVDKDSVEKIAARYQVDPERLMAVNRLSNPCTMIPSQLLVVPISGPVTYTVQAGETVASIAELFQVNPLSVITPRVGGGQPARDPLAPGQTVAVQFGDVALAASIKAAGNVILNGEVARTQELVELRWPLIEFREGMAGFGITNIRPEADSAVHRIQAWNTALDQVHYAWPIVAASLYTGLPLGGQPTALRLALGDVSVPLESGFLRVNFRGPEGAIPTYSFLQVVNGDYALSEPGAFKDKIVFVGATSESLHDTYPTPFDFQNATPGVEIMANALDTVLSSQYVVRLPPLAALLSILAAGGVALGIAAIRNTGLAILALFGLVAALVLFWLAAFMVGRIEVPIVAPVLTLFIAFSLPALERAVSEELEKRRVRGIFEMFISPEMVGQLIEQGIDAMRGQRAELTILFSDIRGFTTMSEKLTPEELVDLLNEYLGVMTDVIHRNGGTVDKYEGDLVMAFFGAPIHHADHAQRAARTAIEMRQELDRLRAKWAVEGKPANLEMGIGLNSGEVFVGLVGSGRRVNYTVMGDAVNLASRLQDLTKDLKWPLLISEYTHSKIQDQFDTEFAESRLVKGKTVPVDIYKVLGQKGAPEAERVLAELYA